ncbi:hypothetical protein K523DRAFT_109766 [Schizophyllum commune Tattone D]|nr:hypothetical protein K523DRAFT_109766 [Schizophyllum commune Tattone D]
MGLLPHRTTLGAGCVGADLDGAALLSMLWRTVPSPGCDRRLNCESACALHRSPVPCCSLCCLLALIYLSSPETRRDHPAVPRLGRGARDPRLLTVGDSGCTHNVARPSTTTTTTMRCGW